MSYTDNSTRQWRDETSPAQRNVDGMVRRMAIKLTSGVFWQAVGHLLFDNATREVRQAEVFSGVGFYGRPKSGHRAEAIVVFPGGAGNPVIIATRDEDARRAVAQIAEDETAVFNSKTIILIKADGTVEITRDGGTASSLVKLSEFNAHTHPAPGGATSAPTAATGTTVLKAQ